MTGSVVDYWFYLVMEAAEILTASAGTNNILTIIVTGDELTLG